MNTSRSLPVLADDGEAGQGEAAGHGEGQAVSLAGRWGEGGTARVLAPRALLCEREADRLRSCSCSYYYRFFPPPGVRHLSVCAYLRQGLDIVCVKSD